MKAILLAAQLLLIALPAYAAPVTPRPHLRLSRVASPGATTVDDFRKAIREDALLSGRWKQFLTQAEHDLSAPVVLPGTYGPNLRSEADRQRGNRDHTVVFAAGQRILRGALASLVTGEMRYRAAAWRQIEALFNDPGWRDWRDLAHVEKNPADLRTGMLARDLGLAYDWMYESLTPEQRRWLIAGLEERAIKPFWKSVEQKLWWTGDGNNWTTAICGGLGVLGMSLGEDHPDSAKLVAFSRTRMEAYLKGYGREGEFNEGTGYSMASSKPVDYFAALRCATGGREPNPLAGGALEATAVWSVYTFLPPGRYAAFGDAGIENPMQTSWFGPVAAATRSGALQWFARRGAAVPDGPVVNMPSGGRECGLPDWLLGFDPSLPERSPEGVLPHGRAFHDHGMIVSSRTDWNAEATPCVVYGKAGIERYHHHHDAGQVCLDGYGQRLITDLGSMAGYPLNYAKDRERYYNSAWEGHNVLTFSGKPMPSPKVPAKGKFLATEFDDRRGGWWRMDLTKFYPGARRVVRTVVHLNPATVAVLDEADFKEPAALTLRWHTIDRAVPDPGGRFTVTANGVSLSALVARTDGGLATFSQSQHEYRAPWNKNRSGDDYPQPHESFVLTQWTGTASRVLSLFTITPKGTAPEPWQETAPHQQWQAGTVTVDLSAAELRLHQEGTAWTVPLR